jgi:hypothetical protein
MQSILDYIDEVSDTANRLVNEMELVSADKVGLDIRVGRLWVSEDCVVTTKARDRNLQYYGGFEYVDKDCRNELGDFVVYVRDDGRVQDCIERWLETNTESAEEQAED